MSIVYFLSFSFNIYNAIYSITNITTNMSSNPLGLSMVSTCRHENTPNVAPQQPRPLSAALEEVLVLNYVFSLLIMHKDFS